jgi:flavodoxin I
MLIEGKSMNVKLVYFSRGGNTRKVADVIAKELGITAVDVAKESPDVSKADLLIVGSGTEGGKAGKPMIAFLSNLAPVTGKQAACFATASGDSSKMIAAIKENLTSKGYKTVDSFSCFGKMSIVKRGHPSEEELNKAKEFAKKLVTKKD